MTAGTPQNPLLHIGKQEAALGKRQMFLPLISLVSFGVKASQTCRLLNISMPGEMYLHDFTGCV